MSTVERPRELSIISVLAFIASIICIVAGIIYIIQTFSTLSLSIIAGILLLISGLMALTSGVFGVYSVIQIFGNKVNGVKYLLLYSILSVSFEVIKQISDLILFSEMTLNAWKLLFLFFIPVFVFVTIITRNRFDEYTSSLV